MRLCDEDDEEDECTTRTRGEQFSVNGLKRDSSPSAPWMGMRYEAH